MVFDKMEKMKKEQLYVFFSFCILCAKSEKQQNKGSLQ